MTDDVYRELQRHLDRMPVPFPATESGVEIRILQQLFTPEEASLALELSAIPESLDTIQHRTNRDLNDLRESLERMAQKGAIQKMPGPKYSKAPLVVGMYERQLGRLTPELERDVRQYLDEKLGAMLHSQPTPQMRTVPVNKSIEVDWPVANYDDMRKFVQSSPGPFAAQDCICRQGRELTGDPCRQTKERRNCLLFGPAAYIMVKHHKDVASEVTREEMLALLDQADREGLVLQPQNTQEPMFVCCCCGCCCGVLTTAKKMEHPAEFFQTDFIAEANAWECDTCGVCGQRCQMDAITYDEGAANVSKERCIGCGLCVTTCSTGAMRLLPKQGAKAPPKDIKDLYLTMFQERFGRLGAATALAGHFIGRKF